jgi:hypothetical protein
MLTDPEPTDAELHEQIVQATMLRTGCTREEAKIIMRRIGDRLVGYTHDEVAEMHPLPAQESEGRETG